MKPTRIVWASGLLAALAALPALAQDSVSRAATGSGQSLPGDAVSPWDTTEQCNNYVVDLQPFQTFAGREFGIAPLIKSSKTDALHFGSLFSAQSLSRRVRSNVPFHADAYAYWNAPGYGVNNNPAINSNGAMLDTSNLYGDQFATIFSEFATTDSGASYNAVIGAVVNLLPSDPSRLYVSRKVAAVNGCNAASNYSQFGVGSVDEDGNLHFRADNFGTSAGTCGLINLPGYNIFRMNLTQRSCNALNVISGDFPGGAFDSGAGVAWLVRNNGQNHNPPNMMPASMTGAAPPMYLGGNYNKQYVRGSAFGAITSDLSHLAPGLTDHRGNFAYTARNFGRLNSTHGVSAALNQVTDTFTMGVFGVNAVGNVTGKIGLTLPASITDVTTGATNIPGANEFDQYHGSTGFRGGTGPIALAIDANGDLLAAAEVDHPASAVPWNLNYLAVARVSAATGATQWTMAAYNYGPTGKPILDGAGVQIGQLVSLDNISGAPFGQSISSPAFDSAGNIWFISALELFDPPAEGLQYTSGLFRGVYHENYNGTGEPGYELELVLYNHEVFHGRNSDLDYEINFLSLAASDGNANPASLWSSNVSEAGHLGLCPVGLDNSDPRTLGGLVLHAEIVYDSNSDGEFAKSTGNSPDDPTSPDQDYNVLLYVGALAGGATAADADGDDDVDLRDAAHFQACFTGSSGTVASGCEDADLDCDGAVDLMDYLIFQRAHQAPR